MGLIPADVIDEIRQRADIVAIIGQHIALKKAGQNHKGLCPFHQEKTPSFHVNSDKRFFYCFGCQKRGDVFTFLMEFEGKSFVETAEVLSAVTGVDIPEGQDAETAIRQRSERTEMLETCRLAGEFFAQTLDGEQGQLGRAYLKQRKIDLATAKAFRLGFAPLGWHGLGDFLSKQGVAESVAQSVGLLVPQKTGQGSYDRFRNRLMCPVILPGGEIAGFSGRLVGDVDERSGAKYINSPESPIYKKSKLLFGLQQARDGFRQRGRAVLVEGNFDVISLHQAGFNETVAPLGTALTDQQVDQLRRFGVRVILLYDGDSAGQKATLRALQTLLAAEVDTYIASLPPNQDPDSYVHDFGSEALAALLDRAQPGIEYFIHEVWSTYPPSADGRSKALKEAAQLFQGVTNTTKRDLIAGTLSAAMNLDLPAVRRALYQRRPTPPARSTPNQPARRILDIPPPRDEVEILAILADHPGLLELAEENNVFSLLTDARLQDMYVAARQESSFLSATNELSPSIAKHVLAGAYAKVTDPRHCLFEAVARLKQTRRHARLNQLQHQAQTAKRRGDIALERQLVREILTTRRQVD